VPPWNLNCVAQEAALAAFAEGDLLRRTPAAVAAARADLAVGLEGLPGVAAVLPGTANFLCVRLERPIGGSVVQELRDRHAVLVRDLSGFPGMGPAYLRTAVRSPAENARLLAALAAVLEER
jgi:threonine-phosphate decarboxylase